MGPSEVAAMLRDRAGIHRIAERIVATEDRSFALWRSHAATLLALVTRIPLRDAKAVIAEFVVDN